MTIQDWNVTAADGTEQTVTSHDGRAVACTCQADSECLHKAIFRALVDTATRDYHGGRRLSPAEWARSVRA